jgi:DNA-binding MarR family transcriptional regulator
VQHVFDVKGEYEVTFTISDGSTIVINTYLVNIIEKENITEPSDNKVIEKGTPEDIPDFENEDASISEDPVKYKETGSLDPIPETDYFIEEEPEIPQTMPSTEADKDDIPDFPITSFTASVCSLIIAMISLSMPLYMKIKVKDLLKNPKRKSIYHYIKTNPGDNFNTIKQSLGLTNGVLSYHLKVLEREKFIISYRDGGFKRFYLSGEKEINNAKRINGNQRMIMDVIKEFPGISQTEIAKKTKTTVQVVNYHIKRLLEDDLIRIEMTNGHRSQCFPKNLEIVTPI